MMRGRVVAFAILLAGCNAGPSHGADTQGAIPGDARAANAGKEGTAAKAVAVASTDPGTVAGGPGTLQHYGVGHRATTADVARWNRDVGPDGAELPPGNGTVAQGEQLYRAKCATCHNTNGQGMPPAFPALIGRDEKAEGFRFASDPKLVKTIGNYWPNATTVFDYVRRAMPQTQPGSLSDRDVYALTAFLLASNRIIPANATLDARSLRAVRMPYADRFVRDDRHGGKEVK